MPKKHIIRGNCLINLSWKFELITFRTSEDIRKPVQHSLNQQNSMYFATRALWKSVLKWFPLPVAYISNRASRLSTRTDDWLILITWRNTCGSDMSVLAIESWYFRDGVSCFMFQYWLLLSVHWWLLFVRCWSSVQISLQKSCAPDPCRTRAEWSRA